jgi:hypothetical protein
MPARLLRTRFGDSCDCSLSSLPQSQSAGYHRRGNRPARGRHLWQRQLRLQGLLGLALADGRQIDGRLGRAKWLSSRQQRATTSASGSERPLQMRQRWMARHGRW